MRRINGDRVRDLAIAMTGWPSETGTAGEAAFAGRLAALLRDLPCFRDNPDLIRLVPSHGDPLTSSVVALVRGTGKQTVMLVGHFDTAAIDNYHEMQHLACDTLALKDALIESLSARPDRSEQEKRALADLLTGDFLPGRGLLDMKSGLAIAIACLEQFAADPERKGNLLLVATPDEERESRGIRSFRDALPTIASDLDLEIAAAINLDVTSDQGDGREGRAVFAGTIGKLLPFALVIGRNSHAAYPFEGVSAQAIAAGILTRLEGNASLADQDERDISPPPICLEAKDLRDGYEVTTPERFWLAFNWLYHAMTADALFERFRSEVLQGAAGAVERFAAQAAAYSTLLGRSVGAAAADLRLLTFRELRAEAARVEGDTFEQQYAETEQSLNRIDNPLVVSRRLTEWLVDVARLTGPAIVIGFAGLHYPPAQLDTESPLFRAVETALSAPHRNPEHPVSWKPVFQGISDMSFLGLAAGSGKVVSENTPISRLVDVPPPGSLAFPAINLGPWGREFHQKYERLYAPYAFDVLPDLVYEVAMNVLGEEQGARDKLA